MNQQNFLETLKPHLGLATSIISGVATIALSCAIAYGNYTRKDGASDVQSKELERRVVMLENDRATRSEVQALNASFGDYRVESRNRLQHIEDMLVKELQHDHSH